MVFIKICGVTRAEDAELASRLAVDAVGINFFAGSPRRVGSRAQAQAVRAALPDAVRTVGVWVNADQAELVETCKTLAIGIAQLHGGDIPSLAEASKRSGLAVIPACGVRDENDLDAARSRIGEWRAAGAEIAGVLVDARVPGLHGGTGRTAPWELLADLDLGAPLILAGGLTPDNVSEAIRRVRPYGVDVASGVESSPGIKDAALLRRFVENARSAAI